MVKTFYAPKEVLPPTQRAAKRPVAETQVKLAHTSSGVCFDFQKGECRRGSKCKFTHDGPENALAPSKSRREEVSNLMGEVKGLSSTTFVGMAKKKNKVGIDRSYLTGSVPLGGWGVIKVIFREMTI